MADPVEAAARHGVAAGLLGAGGHGKGPLDPLLTRQGGLQSFELDDFL